MSAKLEAGYVTRVTAGYLTENVAEKINGIYPKPVTTVIKRDPGGRRLEPPSTHDLELTTTTWELATPFHDKRWPDAGGMLQQTLVQTGLPHEHRPTPRGFDHKDNGTRSTDAFVNVVAVLTPHGKYTEFVPLDAFSHCDGDDTRWENWEALVKTRGRLSGGSFYGELGSTVFSSHRVHAQAESPFGHPVVKLFATYALKGVPFAPTDDAARFSGLPQSMAGYPDPPPPDGKKKNERRRPIEKGKTEAGPLPRDRKRCKSSAT